ncbi:DUF58 domain-containing protein [Campylobacter geochelonis]|uniref:DUF58 domain-containing protein n=1 Tax=Campylobacter geochelonis TaxID=1780362 RepID=UPI000770B3A9|nr:DUF58 domain-containing protein [Campylobacter geochelonis]CZE51216.1 Uncharacterized conserved protein (some members contain a von Willebrand factor type A (vWA) domain) [Campylobacter geochelonis]
MQRARELFLKAKKDVYNLNFGNAQSSAKSDGLDFSEIRDYQNDELKKINWKATAKNLELKVNLFNETRQLNVVVAFMLSASMKFGSFRLKQDVASEVFALLSLATVTDKNLLYPYLFSDKLERIYEPTKSEDRVYDIVENALDTELLGKKADYEKLCDSINSFIKKRAMVFVIGDFLGDVNLSKIALYNDVYAVIIRDRLEENLEVFDSVDFINPLNLAKFEANITKQTAHKYNKLLKEHDFKLEEHFFKHKISFGKIYTDDDILLKLMNIVRS